MKRESRTVDRSDQVDSPTQRHLPLVDLLVDTRADLMELAVASGLKVLQTMLEEDRTTICGQRYQRQGSDRPARAGTVPSEVVLGGRKVTLRRPRVRANGERCRCPPFERWPADPLRHVWGDVSLSMFRRGGILGTTPAPDDDALSPFPPDSTRCKSGTQQRPDRDAPLLPQFDSGKCLKCFPSNGGCRMLRAAKSWACG